MSSNEENSNNNQMEIDDVPIVSSNDKFMRLLEEQLQKENALNQPTISDQESTNTSSSSSNLITSKNWKERAEAYDKLVNTFNTATSEDCFLDNEQYLSQCITEKNAAVLEKGLQVLFSFVDKFKRAARTAEELVPHILKLFSSTRTSTIKLVNDILLLYIEVDCGKVVINQLIHYAITNNESNPKIRSGCIGCITRALRSFGPQAITIKPILACMSKLLSDTNSSARSQAVELTVELFRWLKDAITIALDTWELKPAQKKDILSLFEKEGDTTLTPDRTLRSGKVQNASLPIQSLSSQQPEETDPLDLLEPQDVLSKIPSEWFNQMSEIKWSIRRDALVELHTLLSRYPKLQVGDYYPIVSRIAVVLESDKNIVVVKHAVEVIEQLAKGLKKGFTYSSTLVPFLFQKFKEKKLSDSVMKALDSIDKNSQSFEEFLENICVELDIKSNAVSKQSTLTWLEICLARRRTALSLTTTKTLAQKLVILSDDANSNVRELSFKILARLQWLGGEKHMAQLMSKMDKIKTDRVSQFVIEFGPSTVSSTAEVSAPAQTTQKDVVKKKTALNKTKKTAPAKPVPKASAPSTATATTIRSSVSRPTTTAKKPAKKQQVQVSAESDDLDLKIVMSKEEVMQKACELIPESTRTGLSSSAWKDRVQSMEDLEQFVKNMDEASLALHKELIVRYISYVPGWAETNVQSVTKIAEVVTHIISNSNSFGKGTAATVIEGIVEKLATAKANVAGKTCLTAMAELLLPQFVFSQLYKRLAAHKNPKVTAEGVSWMTSALSEFGVVHLKVDQLIDFTKTCLNSSNPLIKKNCTELLCEMRKFMGDGLLDFLNDIKPALLTAIKKEFDKLPSVPTPAPTRQIRSLEVDNSAPSAIAPDMLPRTDIKSRISSKILKNLDDNNWKARLAAVNEIEQIINEANKRIQANLSELINALKKRLDDPNVKTLTSTLSLLSLIAVATGSAVEKYCKLILTNVIAKLSHNNKAVRTLALSTLEVWVEIVTLEPMLKFFPKGLSTEKGHPEGRKDVLSFILKHIPGMKVKDGATFEPIVKTIIESIQDPKPETRKVAEQILPEVVAASGVEEIRKYCRDLKPAFRQTVNAILDKYANIEPAQPEVTSNIATSNAMDIDDMIDTETKKPEELPTSSTPTTIPQSFKQHRTVVRRPIVEIPSSNIDTPTCNPPGSQTPRMPERVAIPPLIIADLDDSQPISIHKLIASIQIDPINNENSINALKKLVEILNNDRRAVVPHVKELVECLTSSVQRAFEMAAAGLLNIRICKYLLNAMMVLFSKRNIAELIDKESLQSLIHQLLTRLLDEKLPLLEDGQALLRAFNQLMINILQNSNRTATYTALLNLLTISHDDLSFKKYTELVVKCLLKLTKALQSTIDRIQVDILLMDLHQFLTANPPTQFKNKDDLPLRTVKTILNELVKVKGPSIRTHLSFIPTHKNPLIVSYIELMLTNAQKQKEKEVTTIAANDQLVPRSTSPSITSSSQNTDEMNDLLNDIFTCISNKDTCNTGLFRLYKFQKTYPEADINEHLSRCSEVFQVYIKRQLIKIEEHEARSSQATNSEPQNVVESNAMSSITKQATTQKDLSVPSVSTGAPPLNRTYTLSSMDAIRAEVKRIQQERQQQAGSTGNVRSHALTRSLSVQDIRRRFRAAVPENETTSISSGLSELVTSQTMEVTPDAATIPTSTSSDQLEALKNRIRAKARQQQLEEQRRQSASIQQSFDSATLRARLSQHKHAVAEEEKENQPSSKAGGASSLKERLSQRLL